ncbi:MAG TPA: hypothetical protein VJ797_06510 [Burkholderiales bacterium]|nr:hypothetical protein [Burkholderiales bacterium]
MKSIVRAALLVVAFTATGCVSDAEEVAQVSLAAAAESTPIYSDMHAAIPAGKDGNVFEYN